MSKEKLEDLIGTLNSFLGDQVLFPKQPIGRYEIKEGVSSAGVYFTEGDLSHPILIEKSESWDIIWKKLYRYFLMNFWLATDATLPDGMGGEITIISSQTLAKEGLKQLRK